MPLTLPAGYTWDPRLRLGDETARLTRLVWPAFLVDESDIAEPSLKFRITVDELRRRLPVWGIRRESDGRLIAYGNALLISAPPDADEYPDAGWRFAMEALGSPQPPDCVCLLSASVDPEFRHLGFARALLERAKEITRELGFDTLLGPVRPVLKHLHPDISIDDYLKLRSDSGEVFDPWLRLHAACGAQVLNICRESVIIKATIGKWKQWTGLALLRSGSHPLPRGLADLEADLDADVAIYREPNVWVRYRLSARDQS